MQYNNAGYLKHADLLRARGFFSFRNRARLTTDDAAQRDIIDHTGRRAQRSVGRATAVNTSRTGACRKTVVCFAIYYERRFFENADCRTRKTKDDGRRVDGRLRV